MQTPVKIISTSATTILPSGTYVTCVMCHIETSSNKIILVVLFHSILFISSFLLHLIFSSQPYHYFPLLYFFSSDQFLLYLHYFIYRRISFFPSHLVVFHLLFFFSYCYLPFYFYFSHPFSLSFIFVALSFHYLLTFYFYFYLSYLLLLPSFFLTFHFFFLTFYFFSQQRHYDPLQGHRMRHQQSLFLFQLMCHH